jgi:hypothetical protein
MGEDTANDEHSNVEPQKSEVRDSALKMRRSPVLCTSAFFGSLFPK